jgi:aspartyl-tRNA(Asn)/glutamyl-tRNA(Gln) amidotransferase subunit A
MKCYISENSEKVENAEKAVAVDDTVLVKGMPCTAGSKMLSNYEPLFDAEVVARLYAAGYEISGKTNVGEFGLDLLGETSYFGACKNTGGELMGAAAALVAAGNVEYALNVDLNGYPRRAAALQDVTFIKPTYGTVSRYGIIPCACSAEQVGVTASSTEKAAGLLAVIAGHDDKDGTSLPAEKYEYTIGSLVEGMRFGIPSEYLARAEPAAVAKVTAFGEAMRANGAAVEEFSFPELALAQPAWQILLASETCNNLSRYDGAKFGYRTENYKSIEELYMRSRSESFGLLTKFAILYGSDVLSKGRYDNCYDKALRIRRILRDRLDEVFTGYDCILAPACSKTSYTLADAGKGFDVVYSESFFTALASITGIPVVVSGGIQVMGNNFEENKLLTAASVYEKRVSS